jgi:exosortase
MSKLLAHSEFLVLCAISVVAGWHPLASTLALAASNDEYTHIVLILPVAATLILMDWHTTRQMAIRNPRGGAAFLLTALVAIACTRRWSVGLSSDVRLSLGMLALVLWWVGSFVLCFGIRISRALLFPLCFLFWMVPFPKILLDAVIRLLQHGSALSARLLFASAAVPVAQDGLMLSIPGLTVEVAKECSSIRSSLMLLVTTMVLAQLLLRSPWRKVLVIVLAIPLSVAKNGLRIFTLAMLGTRVDPAFLNGRLHRQGGIVFFAIALCVIFLLLWILRQTEPEVTQAAALRPVGPEALTMVSGR